MSLERSCQTTKTKNEHVHARMTKSRALKDARAKIWPEETLEWQIRKDPFTEAINKILNFEVLQGDTLRMGRFRERTQKKSKADLEKKPPDLDP